MLEQFLCSCRDQIEVELHNQKADSSWVEVYALTKQSNLLGTILNLPRMVAELKKQFDEIELRNIKLKEDSVDPLNLGGI